MCKSLTVQERALHYLQYYGGIFQINCLFDLEKITSMLNHGFRENDP